MDDPPDYMSQDMQEELTNIDNIKSPNKSNKTLIKNIRHQQQIDRERISTQPLQINPKITKMALKFGLSLDSVKPTKIQIPLPKRVGLGKLYE